LFSTACSKLKHQYDTLRCEMDMSKRQTARHTGRQTNKQIATVPMDGWKDET
jgi:hypothetical protein